MKRLALYFLAAVGVIVSGCGSKVLYKESLVIPDAGWAYADTLEYRFSVSDTLQIYDLSLTVWHKREYPFQNVYVNVHTMFPGGEKLKERLSLEMMDSKESLWLGKCGRERCRLDIVLQEGAFFQQPGEYALLLEQHTRMDTLPGIEQIALQIEATDMRR